MTPNKLPPLPEPDLFDVTEDDYRGFSAKQMNTHYADGYRNGMKDAEALRQSQSLPAGAVAGLAGKWRDESKVSAITYSAPLRECADELEQALQADAREKGEAVGPELIATTVMELIESARRWGWRQAGGGLGSEEMEQATKAVAARLATLTTAALATQPAQASEKDGCVSVPRDALLTEARRLRYRATETCGLGPETTDAGAQMIHTAEALEGFASSQHGESKP